MKFTIHRLDGTNFEGVYIMDELPYLAFPHLHPLTFHSIPYLTFYLVPNNIPPPHNNNFQKYMQLNTQQIILLTPPGQEYVYCY